MEVDTHGSKEDEWIGFDIDGTLAKYDGWKGIEHIGEPVDTMVIIAKMLHRIGKKIKVMTARVAPRDDGEGGDKAKKYVEAWCKKNLGFVPEITYEKDASMAALFDDRAVAVEQNTGKVLGGWPDSLPKSTEKAKDAILEGSKLKSKLLALRKRRDTDRIATEKKADDIESIARRHYPEDGSHGWNHIQDVLANARRMRRRELLKKELAAIMYHDSSLMTGRRETHAEDSAAIARKELAGLFKRRQLEDIVNAIAHHRASYEGARSSRLEDLVAAADRPVPDLAKQVARSWKYHEELGEPESLRAENVASHLKEKYGHGGYAYGNAPGLYLRTYGRELRDIMSKFDDLTPEAVASMMSGMPEKKADDKSERLAKARAFVLAVKKEALKRKLNFFLVTDGASGIMNNDNPAVRNAREAQIKWELEHGHDPYEDWSKRAEIELKDGKYDDVKRVYDGLTDEEKNFVTPGRRIYKDVPRYLAGRTVAYDGKYPIGFSDIYGYNNDGSLRSSPNICLAVSEDGRGKRLAGAMTKDVMRKVLERAKELRAEKGIRADKIKRFVWMVLNENEASARAAINSGFKEVPYRDGKQRKFIMSRMDAEKIAEYSRYSVGGIGIYQALKNAMSDQEWKEFLSSNDAKWLRKPSSYPYGASSWFTEEGEKKFREKVLPKIAKRIMKSRIKKDISMHPGKILYRDKDQIVSKAEKDAASRPSKEDLWRMYDIMQADARLAKKVEGLGFGRSGDSYRKAAIKLKVMELARVVKDGKKIRNNIAHMPGYIPSRYDAERALRQYTEAEKKVDGIASE